MSRPERTHATAEPAAVLEHTADADANREAVAWLMRLEAGPAGEKDLTAWRAWRQASPSHEKAWRRVERLNGTLQNLPPELSVPVLTRAAAPGRRAALKTLAIAGIATPLLWGAARQVPWHRLNADYTTGTGEQRRIVLEDGSSVVLNTLGSLDVRYTATQRLLRLRDGDILVQTSPRHDPRPLYVETIHGRMQALGTRFLVQVRDSSAGLSLLGSSPHAGSTLLGVLEHRVALTTAQEQAQPLILESGQKIRFGPDGLGPVLAGKPQDYGWVDGVLYANETPLGDFLDELSRYRPGIIRYTPEAARLRITGAYQLPDSDRILETLASVLPIRIAYRSRFWVQVSLR